MTPTPWHDLADRALAGIPVTPAEALAVLTAPDAELMEVVAAASRLRFVHAHTREALCQYWQEVQLGLAPPVDAGDQALSTCLWMGRPFVALAASLPWSHRPAALLHCAGASAWIADSASRYVELASRLPQAPDPSLRARLRAAGLEDPAAFARGFAATMADLMQAAPAPSPAP